MSTPTALLCPRCKPLALAAGQAPPHLHSAQAAGMTLHACTACGGVFLSTQCANKLASSLPTEAIRLAARAGDNARHHPDLSAPIHCPVCDQEMRRTKLAAQALEIDSCGAHGTFYDKDEMARLAVGLRKAGWGTYGAAATAGAVAGAAAAPHIEVSTVTPEQGAAFIDQAATAIDVADVAASVVGFVFELLASAAD